MLRCPYPLRCTITHCWDLCYWPIHRFANGPSRKTSWSGPQKPGALNSGGSPCTAKYRQVVQPFQLAQMFSLVFDDEFQPRESWVQGRGPAMQASPTGVTTHCVTRQDELVTTEFPPCCRCFLAKRCSLDARRIIGDASNEVMSNLCLEGPLKVSTIVI